MHQRRRGSVRAAAAVLLCCLGHQAQAFLPSVVSQHSSGRHMNLHSTAAASTPLPAMEASAGAADADDDGETSSPSLRRETWLQPFVANAPAASVSGGTSSSSSSSSSSRSRIGVPGSSSSGSTPVFLNRQAHYDMSASAAGEAAAAAAAAAAVAATRGDETITGSAEERQAPAASAPSSPRRRRSSWVQPSHPPTPVDTATAKSASDRVGVDSWIGQAPQALKRKAYYDMSASAALAASKEAAAAAAVAATTNSAEEEQAPAASAPSSPTRRTSWVQPSHPPTPVDTATAKIASDRVESLPSRPGITPAFLSRKAHYDMSASAAPAASSSAAEEQAPAAAAAEPGSSPPAGKVVLEPASSSPDAISGVAAASAPSPQAAGSSAEAAAAASVANASSSSSSSSPKAPPAAAAAAASSSEAPAPAVKATPPPPAAKAASAPPPPVEFEPEPTLLSDSPVYQDVALTIKRAKDTLAPFRKKIQDNVAEGNVGERGEEWAVAQFAILLFVAMGSVPLVGGLITLLAGPGLLAGGIGVCAAGLKGLGKSLSPWPAPIEDNELNTEGIYGMMRHPMYTGLVMFCLGFGVVTDSPLRMLLAVVLALVLDKKADKEEKMLIGLHGRAYEDYRNMVAKFVPRFY